MTVCPVCGKECHSDYCIFCMRPIYAEDTKKKTKKIFSRSDDISDIIDPELYDEETVSYVRNSYEQAKKEARINALKHNSLVLGIFLLCVMSVMIVNKIDTAPIFDFDLAAACERACALNPRLAVFPVSARTGEGFDELADYLKAFIQERRAQA